MLEMARDNPGFGLPGASTRADWPWTHARATDGVEDPQGRRRRPRISRSRAELACVPSWPGEGILTADFHAGTVFLRRLCMLFFIEHGTQRVHLAETIDHPAGAWVIQQARNLLTNFDDHTDGLKLQLCDRDAKFTMAFDAVFTAVACGSSRLLSGRPGQTRSPQGG
jgi:hypothetical protein